MGVTFEGIYVPGADLDAVLRGVRGALPSLEMREVPEVPAGARGAKLFVHRSTAGVVEVVGLLEDRGLDLARALSATHGVALAAGVEAGELWHYTLFHAGKVEDRFLSIPDLAGDEAEEVAGDPAKLAARWPAADAARLGEIMTEPGNHPEAQLEELLAELGVPGAMELPAEGVTRLLLEVQGSPRTDSQEDEPSAEEQEEAVREMLGAAGIDDARGQRYLELMKRYEQMLESAGGFAGEASLESLAARLAGNTEFKSVARELSAMRDEVMSGLEKTMEEAGRSDARIGAALERSQRASRVELEVSQNMSLLGSRPRDALRRNAEVLDELLEDLVGGSPGRDADAVRDVVSRVEAARGSHRALMRDLTHALPALLGCYVADCVLRHPGVDLVRLPESGQVRLRKSGREADPFAWAAEALSRRSPRPLAALLDPFLSGA